MTTQPGSDSAKLPEPQPENPHRKAMRMLLEVLRKAPAKFEGSPERPTKAP